MTSWSLRTWVLIWLITSAFLLFRHWRANRGVGLVLAYVASFGSIHWLAPALNLLPGNEARFEYVLTAGTRQATLAMVMFVIGTEAVNWIINRREAGSGVAAALATAPEVVNPITLRTYLIAGFVLYGVLFPVARSVPSVGAVVGTGATLFVIAIALNCWNAWWMGKPRTMWLWLAGTLLLPLFTVATQGFLGYGLAAMMTVVTFVAAFLGPRPKIVVAAALLSYLGLSVYVTYMRDRAELREIVWSGASLGTRVDSVLDTLGEVEWFDLENPRHLHRIDLRLNQNLLIGAAVEHVRTGHVEFARGSTVVDALLAIVPRALWPNKPMSAGSGELVSIYTGIKFDRSTSVGIGQVLECYINFGTTGVTVGFLLIGVLLGLADRRAYQALVHGAAEHFTLWYLPGLSLLQLGGSFVEVTSTAAAGTVMALLLRHITHRMPAYRQFDPHAAIADARSRVQP